MVFKMPALKDPKYQAFHRYINRESHSDARNIVDWKEFNYETFKQGLRLVFNETGYLDHFEAMLECQSDQDKDTAHSQEITPNAQDTRSNQ